MSKTPFVKIIEPIKTLSKRCCFDGRDLVCVLESVLHLSGAALPSRGPCLHRLAHHSKHFNNTVLTLKTGLGGLTDTPISQAHRARLRSRVGDEANKGRQSAGSSGKSRERVLEVGFSVRLLRRSLPEDHSPPSPTGSLQGRGTFFFFFFLPRVFRIFLTSLAGWMKLST